MADAQIRLPVPLTSFVGRESDVAAVVTMLGPGPIRLVTLTGPGGVGKTRLALRVAEELTTTFAAGVAFVGLAPIRDPAHVVSAIADGLGLRDAGSDDIGERLTVLLASKELLLVLDNFEQVAQAAPTITDLLVACTHVKVLVTSRVILHLSGERVYVVPPLDVPAPDAPASGPSPMTAAVRLFVERVQAVDRGFALTDANAVTVGAICRRLDGLPLAIELAAARYAILPPAALLLRLQRSLPILTAGPLDAPRRLRTMRDAIAWSYDLLPPTIQALFRHLSVFVGGFPLDAAEMVVRSGSTIAIDPVEGITALVEASLIRREGGGEDETDAEPRFGMLETVREFGLEQLAKSGEDAAARLEHARYFLAVAERVPPSFLGPGLRSRLGLLEVEHANFRVALDVLDANGETESYVRLANGLFLFWFVHGHLAEGRQRLERAVVLASHVSPPTRAKAYLGAAWMARFQGDGSRAITLLDEALPLFRAIGDDWGVAYALLLLGTEYLFRGDLAQAEPILAEALAMYQTREESALSAILLDQLGILASYRGNLARAESLLEQALTIQRELGDEFGAAYSLSSLASSVCLERGDFRDAAARLAESVALNWAIGNSTQLAWCFHGLARAAAEADLLEPAARMFGVESAVRTMTAAIVPPIEQVAHAAAIAAVRERFEPDTFTMVWAAGAALSLNRAVDEALIIATQIVADDRRASRLDTAPDVGLSPREREVLRLLGAGLTDQQIADALFVSRRTITTHVGNILAKLGVANRTEAVAHAVRLGLA